MVKQPARYAFLETAQAYFNLSTPQLIDKAVKRNEGQFIKGVLVAHTGIHTGRSSADKFIVRGEESEGVWWDSRYQRPLEPHHFEALLADVKTFLVYKELYALNALAGADLKHSTSLRVTSELAWHALFSKHMFLPVTTSALRQAPEWNILSVPSFKADPSRHGSRSEAQIAISFERKLVIIVGTNYAGEIKKSVFTVLNHLLPPKGILPMHCSANVGKDDDVALFFGMSGTGKTTLSNEPNRKLIGDDEHGWSHEGIYNFEGGCYAKVINLTEGAEPEIYKATHTYGTVLENVVFNPDSETFDFADSSLTENTRSAYPLTSLANAQHPALGGHPKNILFLTADAFGVLPPVAKLSVEQAIYYFLNGYTAKIAGTEKGLLEPCASFETAFSAPFITRGPQVYAALLREKIEEHESSLWLVNTGWTGGPYGVGQRFKLEHTRAVVHAILSGSLARTPTFSLPVFNLLVPVYIPGVPTMLLNPRDTWYDKAAYDSQAAKLARMFAENFEQFAAHVSEDVRQAGPGGR
jgi:phosphoenolpyruvate carboxykinase (ATP)